MHWWFYPDSYDEWVPQREVEGDMCATSVRKFWKVCVRWLKDTDKVRGGFLLDRREPRCSSTSG